MSSHFLEKFLRTLISKGWKQKDIAQLLEITPTHVCRLTKGAPPSIEIVLKLADYFKVSTDEVLGRVDSKEELTKRNSNTIKNNVRSKAA